MEKHLVSVVRYEAPFQSVREVVKLSGGLDCLPTGAKVFIKPNLVFWSKSVPFPKWGVITTSRVVQDMVELIAAHGVSQITIGEGMVTLKPGDNETIADAFKTLGYEVLRKRFGVKLLNIFERPFRKVELGDGMAVNFNVDILESDFVVDLPVMKTHNQTVVSLGIKNLKGMIDIPSRKRCHNMEPGKDLHVYVSRLAESMPPMFTLIDGIYTSERGPGPDGKMHRSNLLVGSRDVLSADMVGAKILGYTPEEVPYIAHAARWQGRPLDFSDIEITGVGIDEVARKHEYDFHYSEMEEVALPLPLVRQGIRGIFYRKYDLSMCTYCSAVNGLVMMAIRNAWKGEPWDRVEVLTGKAMRPTPGMKKTILLGRCMYQAHKDDPAIQEMIAVKGCPPKPEDIHTALRKAGIDADPQLFENLDRLPGLFMKRYEDKPEFEEGHFRVV